MFCLIYVILYSEVENTSQIYHYKEKETNIMKTISKELTREINGGKIYRCRHCNYKSSSYAKVYANALWCVTKKYGYSVLKIVSAIV